MDIINCIIFFTNRLRAIFCYLCSFISFWITSITCSSLSKNSITKYSSGISIPKYSSIYRLGPHNNQKTLILFIRVTLLHLFLIFVLYVLFDVLNFLSFCLMQYNIFFYHLPKAVSNSQKLSSKYISTISPTIKRLKKQDKSVLQRHIPFSRILIIYCSGPLFFSCYFFISTGQLHHHLIML